MSDINNAAPAPDATPAPSPNAPGGSVINQGTPPADPAKPADLNAPKPAEVKPEDKPKAEEKPVELKVEDLKLPEGFTADDPASKEALGAFSKVIGDPALSAQERGQKLIDIYGGLAKQAGEASTKAWHDLQNKWVGEVKADKEIGGDKLEPTRQMISKAIDTLGSDSAKSFRDALDFTGAGNNPAIIRGLAAMAKHMTEGGHLNGSPPKAAQSIQQEFFPNSPEMK